ncbi:MAG: GNAT family N-acetyltransferase [Bacteroidota bacterium]
MKFKVRQASIQKAVDFSQLIFDQAPDPTAYRARFAGVPHLILVAENNTSIVGFKVGYERDGFWYSWLGGVHPDFRRQGIANLLADEQDRWAQAQNYPHVTCKTRNNNSTMQIWALRRGFHLIELQKRDRWEEHRVVLRKTYG